MFGSVTRCYHCSEYLTLAEAKKTKCPYCGKRYSSETKQELKEFEAREKRETAAKSKRRRYKVVSSAPDSGLTDSWEWNF